MFPYPFFFCFFPVCAIMVVVVFLFLEAAQKIEHPPRPYSSETALEDRTLFVT